MAVMWKKLAFNEDVITKAASGANTDITLLHGLAQAGMGHSVFIGESAGLNDDLSDNRNTFIGYEAGITNTTGANNLAIGYTTLRSNTTGTHNSAIGHATFRSNTIGTHNSAVGYVALYSNTTGIHNSAVGHAALYSNTIGNNNVALGGSAGRYHANGTTLLTDPENSVYIGNNAKGKDNADNNSIVIGYTAVGLGANTVVLGNDNITTTALKGNVQLSGELNVNTHKITGVVNPTSAQDAATKAYGDANWGGGATLPVVDTTGIAKGSADATKIVRFEVDGLTTATTRALTVQDKNYTLADHADLHSEAHNIASHSDTTATGAQLNTLVGGGETTLHSHAGGGTVGTFGTPVDNDFAKFTDANTIEGRSYSETRTDLGLVIGTNVQAYDADLTTLGGLAKIDNNFIVGNGSAWVAETGSTARTSLGLGSAATRNAEDTMTDGSLLPDGHAIKAYGDANWGGGSCPAGYEYIVTTKTAAAINTAINSANTAGGGTVLLSSGEYDCTGATYITMKDNVTLSGYGATLKGDAGLNQIIYATGLDNAKIIGITINGQYPGYQGSSGENGILISTGDNITIKDCYIYNMGARGIVITDLTDSAIINNHIVAASMGIRISGNLDKLRINGNQIENACRGGITLACAYNQTITDITISNNVVDQSTVAAGSSTQNIVCYSEHSGTTSGTIRGITVTGNALTGKGSERYGIRMGGDQITIVGNKIYNALGGLYLSKTNDGVNTHTMTDMTVSGNTIKQIAQHGIYIVHANNISICGNTIRGKLGSSEGIYCSDTHRSGINSNNIYTTGGSGIRFNDSAHIECQLNTAYNAGNGGTGFGIYLDSDGSNSSDYIVVANNELTSNPSGALKVNSAGANHTFYNNVGTTAKNIAVRHTGGHGYITNKTGNFYLQPKLGETGIVMVPDSYTGLYYNNAVKFKTLVGGIRSEGTISIKEQAAANADSGSYGQIWVKNTTPNQLWFTDDAGTDIQLGTGGGGGLNNIVEDLTPQLGGNLDCNSYDLTEVGNTYRADNIKAHFGAGSDLSLYHNGTGSYIVNQTGSLYLYANATEYGIRIVPNGAVDLYHNGIRKAWTTAGGFQVDGTVTAACGNLTCDYVFEEDYSLMPLDDLQDFIRTKKKLPHMTIGKGGSYSTATLRIELVEKIEEQASYILQLHERLKVIENK